MPLDRPRCSSRAAALATTVRAAAVVALALGCASAADAPTPASAPASAGPIHAGPAGGDAGSADAGVPVDAASSACPADMVEIDGAFCKRLSQRCLERRKPWQCALFEEPSVCEGDSVSMRFCIDRFEWPNRRGELPVVMSSWRDAKAACEGSGKRLCTDSEWTLACEGPERLPFPYGYRRDAEACPIDKRSPRVDERRLHASQTRDAELARVDQREPSGARPRCVSAFGVHDLTGSVDEFVVNESGVPHKSALKGGNWGEFRNACRPATRKHDEAWRFYQTGFRCCRAPDP